MTPLIPDETKPERARLKGIRILLAEDTLDNQVLLTRILNLSGAKVELAVDGQQAIDKASSEEFDVILMDIQMPGVDGYQATRYLRSRGFIKPIIAVTAHAMKEEKEKCLNAGCNAHISKPVNQAFLVDTIRSFTVAS